MFGHFDRSKKVPIRLALLLFSVTASLKPKFLTAEVLRGPSDANKIVQQPVQPLCVGKMTVGPSPEPCRCSPNCHKCQGDVCSVCKHSRSLLHGKCLTTSACEERAGGVVKGSGRYSRRCYTSWASERYIFRLDASDEPTFRFQVCEGLTNQRIAITQGIAIGILTGLTTVLPSMHTSFRSDVGDNVPFSDYYDEEFLLRSLSLQRFTNHPAPQLEPLNAAGVSNTVLVRANNNVIARTYWEALGRKARKAGLSVELDCAFNSLDTKATDLELISLLWKIDNALRPSAAIEKEIESITRLLDPTGQGLYSALHVRIEQDWVDHCKLWEDVNSSPPRDNCMVNTHVLDIALRTNKVSETIPLYLAGGYTWDFVQSASIFSGLAKHYKVLMKDSLIKDGHLTVNDANREWFAMIDFEICKRSKMFIGNSVSTFSALLELNRIKHKQPTFHYNAGIIPLEMLLPIGRPGVLVGQQSPRLKWVFSVYIGDKTPGSYVKMAKVAVTSALHSTSLDPFCMFNIDPSASLATQKIATEFLSWMATRGVMIIRRTPKWAHQIVYAVNSGATAQNVKYSPLYKDANMMKATFARFDIPILGFTDDYVLYTDVDVMFVSDVTLGSFDTLPTHMLCGTEASKLGARGPWKNLYGNAGIILYNMRTMRNTHKAFVEWVFSPKNMQAGIYFGAYGPGDQGAYNKFYDGLMDVAPSPHFNYKPYWEEPTGETPVSIVHWHGPKVADYEAYLHHCSKTVKYEAYGGLLGLCRCSNTTDVYSGHSCIKWHRRWKQFESMSKQSTVPTRA